jgi:hypothetical protein
MTEARRLTKLVIKFFDGLAGFDEWWELLSPQERKQVEAALEELLANTVP